MHKNNFDFLRLVFATLVLITHSYALSGYAENDFLARLTSGQLNCSSLGVKGFFVISGFLIFQSVLRSKNLGDYFIKRILRIYPAYIVVTIIAILLGAVISHLSPSLYFRDHSVWSYLGNNLAMFLPLHYQIDNVFSTNPYKYAINGSIWTIPYEFLFYIILAFAFILRKNKRLLTILLLLGYVILFLLTIRYENHPDLYIPKDTFEVHLLAHFALLFFGGAALAAVNIHKLKLKTPLFILSCLLCIVFLITKTFYFTQFLILPLVIVFAGSYSTKGICGVNKKMGDFSYGIYLYGFIVQQTLMYYFKFNHLQLMFVSIPVTFIFGALSWFIVEKRALELKKYFP
ncbi:MAG TPA: acyltransferase [Flavipsychrobacter sp.]|nr:acyltransferase [Flavipsychrobacter sp.]